MMRSLYIELPKSYMLHLLYHVFHISMSTAFDPLYTHFSPRAQTIRAVNRVIDNSAPHDAGRLKRLQRYMTEAAVKGEKP